jgi:hypothetical protein
MAQPFASVWLMAAVAFLGGAPAHAADLHVTPNGHSFGSGAKDQPYDLVTALSGSVGKPGDTFWLHQGFYPIGKLETKIHGAPSQPITFRPVPGERAQVVGSLNLWDSIGYVIFRDFELYSGQVGRVSKQLGVGFSPTDLPDFTSGIQVYAPNFSFINLVVHDTVRSAFYTSAEATNTLIHGCLVYNVGWISPDNAEGHSFYLQGAGEVSDCIAFNAVGVNFHLYANSEGGWLRNLTVDGNVAFGAGTLQQVRPSRDWVIGVDKPSVSADNIVLKNNMGFATSDPVTLAQVQIGRENMNGTIVLSSNYWPEGIVLNNWSNATISGNVIAPQNSDPAVDLQQNLTKMTGQWSGNYYSSTSRQERFRAGSTECSFANWKKNTGFDSASCCNAGQLSGTKVFVRSNRYEKGRANIVVYNWDRSAKIAVDVRSVLDAGAAYEVRNAQDFFSPPVLSGTYDGQPLQLPMTGLTVAKPMADLRTPPPTGPTFNVFVLLPKTTK